MNRTASIAICILLSNLVVPSDGLPLTGVQVGHAQQQIPAQGIAQEDPLDSLSKGDYSRRQQATLKMWRQRESSRDQVQEAARHPDPEVAGRAKWILRQWRRGSLPDTPPDISRLLQQTDGPIAIERLLEGGQFTAAVVAVEESAGTVDRERIEQRISAALIRRFPIYIHRALQTDSLPDLLRLVDLVADSNRMAVCRIQLMREMGIEVTRDTLLPSSASTWSTLEKQRATTLILMMLGRVDEAMSVASSSVEKDLIHKCRMIAGRWSEAAQESYRLAKEADPGGYECARHWCLALIAADRAGNKELFNEAVNELTASQWTDDESVWELRWKTLAIHGEIDAAFSILDVLYPEQSAAVSIETSRVERAFDVLGFPLERIDLDIVQWVEEAIQSQRDTDEDLRTQEISSILALMKCLLVIGRDDAAWHIANQLSQCDAMVGDLRVREYVLLSLTTTKRSDWVIRLAVGESEKTLSPESHTTIARTLPDAGALTLEIVVQALGTITPGMRFDQRVHAAYQLLQGELPDGFDRETGFRQLYEFVTTPRPSRARGQKRFSNVLANLDLVSLFARHGEADYAAGCLQKLSQTGDLKALFQVAEQELDGGRASAAQTLFTSLYQTVQDQGRSLGRYRNADDAILAAKALIGLWTVARRTGDEQLSAELEREVRLVLCSPSASMKSQVADYLGERGDTILAMEAYEVLLPMSVFGNEEMLGLYDVARSYSLFARRTNPAEAARWFDMAIGDILDSFDYRPNAYVTLPLYVQRWSVEAAINDDAAERLPSHLDRILKIDPLDIDFAERLLPEMRKAGMVELADETFEKVMDRGLAYADSFPLDAMTCNNVAWVAAMNGKRLEEGLRLSELAVYSEPESAVYRDTLAEVLFQLGRKKEALQVEEACLLDDPLQWHLHEQVRKYSEAIESGDD